MTKPFIFSTGCLSAAAALVLTLSISQPRAQERPAGAPMAPGMSGPGMMTPGTGPHGPGMMTPGTGPHGPGRAGQGAARGAGPGQHAHGGWRERRMARRMEVLDTNGDGKVTLAEIEGELKRLVTAADVNGDGKLSPDEFRRRGRWFLRLRTVSFFDMLDADGDGQVSTAEMLSPSGRWFKRHDEDKDKALSGEELNKSNRHQGRGRGRGR